MNVLIKDNNRSILFIFSITALIFGARLHLIYALGSFAPYYDDWGMGGILHLYETGNFTINYLTNSWNGHMVFWSKLLNIGIFEANQQQWDTLVHMVVNAIVWTLSGVFLISIVRNHFSTINTSVLIVFILILWVFPLSLLNALWGVQTHNYFMILFSIMAIWLCLDKPCSWKWYLGLFFSFAASLTMGGGAFASISIFGITCLRIFFEKGDRKPHATTLGATFILSIFSLWLLHYSSGAQEVYTAKSFADFFTTLFKTLSFPISKDVYPSIIWLLPIVLVGIKAIRNDDLNNRMVVFNLTLFIFTLAIAVAIGYARGGHGRAPSPRYFEFLQLYSLTSALSLLIMQTERYKIKPVFNTALIFVWTALLFISASKQVDILNNNIEEHSRLKPLQETYVRAYTATKEISLIENKPQNHIPFPSSEGLAVFIDKLEPVDMLHYRLQAQPELVSEDPDSIFIKNGTIRPTHGEIGHQYSGENVIGSFNPKQGGFKATGNFTSQVIKPKRSQLMIPIIGYLGYPGLKLKIIDEVTGDETLIQPSELHSRYAELWREIYIDTPKNPFRIVATDNSYELWFGFAAPRTIGRLTVASRWIIDKGEDIWRFGLLLLLFLLRKHIVNLIKPTPPAIELSN